MSMLLHFSKTLVFILAVLGATAASSHAQPELSSWLINTDGASGSFWNNGNLQDNGILCDVQTVQFSENNVYIQSTGVPRYATAPYGDGNPSQASNADYLFQIPRNPEQGPAAGTPTGLGHTAVLINGVPTFNAMDAFSYNNQDVWHQNAGFFELAGFDCAKGHPAMGNYHHHLIPTRFDDSQDVLNGVCANFPSDGLLAIDGTVHSPIIGYAFDGYPIYGPFAYENTDGSGAIVRMESSYSLRDITERHTLADGTQLPPNQYGPDVGALVTPAIPPGADPVEAVLGAYIEDFEFIDGSGHLDAFNGRFGITPEYPAGTYAYFATVDASHNPAYPYFFTAYRGVVETDNFGQGPGGGVGSTNVTIDEPVETYNGTNGLGAGVAPNWTLHPNPASGQVQFSNLTAGMRFQVKDAAGRIVRTECVTGLHWMWDASELPEGMYWVQGDLEGVMTQAKPLLIVR